MLSNKNQLLHSHLPILCMNQIGSLGVAFLHFRLQFNERERKRMKREKTNQQQQRLKFHKCNELHNNGSNVLRNNRPTLLKLIPMSRDSVLHVLRCVFCLFVRWLSAAIKETSKKCSLEQNEWLNEHAMNVAGYTLFFLIHTLLNLS